MFVVWCENDWIGMGEVRPQAEHFRTCAKIIINNCAPGSCENKFYLCKLSVSRSTVDCRVNSVCIYSGV